MTALVSVAAVAGGSVAAPADTGRRLVNRALGYGLARGPAPSVGDVETMLVWMQAASRVSPALAEAYRGQHDLLLLLSRGEEAFEALGRYCTNRPGDQRMRLALMSGSVERLQTATSRIEFCQAQLADTSPAAPIASELHRLLAETHRGVGDLKLAREHAQAACDAFPFNFAARRLLIELLSDEDTSELEVRYLLASISANPSQYGPMWSLARLLDSLSLHEPAGVWCAHARRAHERSNPGRPPPVTLLIDAARGARDAGKFDSAQSLCQQALQVDSDSYEAALLLVESARRGGRDDLAAEQLALLQARIAKTANHVRGHPDAFGAARVAWFHIRTDPDVPKALEFAELAMSIAPHDTRVRRIHGLALLAAERWPQARSVLGPLAISLEQPDQLAAWGLARALVAMGEPAAALDVLRDAELIRCSGRAYEMIVELLGDLGASPLPGPDRGQVVAALDAFATEALEFPDQPGRFLRLTAEPIDPAPRFGQPWRCRFVLANHATCPVTLGDDQMVAGHLLVSARTNAPGVGPFDAYLPIPFAPQPVLDPGQRIEIERSLDVGPLADVAVLMAQRDLEVTFTVILDPLEQQADHGWSSRLGPDLVASTRLVRQGIEYTPAGTAAIVRDLRGENPTRRVAALRTVAGLLAERLAAMRQKLDYTPARIDSRALRDLLPSGLTDPDPAVRAATLDCLAMLPFKDEQAQAAAPLLSDRHWLVRLVAVDFLATHQGSVFDPVAERLAQNDPDALVRQLSQLHLQRPRTAEAAP